MTKKTPLEIATETFKKVYVLHETSDCHVSTGNAYDADDRELTDASDLTGLVLSKITWDTDRGNWAWDGALAALEAVGIDVHAPLAK